MTDPTATTKTCATCFQTIDARAERCSHCAARQPDAPGFHRDVPGRLVAGICAALARHFDWDVALVRVVMVVSLAFTGGLALWIYGALWLMTPYEAHGRSPAQRAADALSGVFASPATPPAPAAPASPQQEG